MSKTKSTTEFDHMLQNVGLTHLKHMFEAPERAWTTAAAFAFAAGHNPNSVSPQRLSQFVVRPLLELQPGDEDDDEHGEDGPQSESYSLTVPVLCSPTRRARTIKAPTKKLGMKIEHASGRSLKHSSNPASSAKGSFPTLTTRKMCSGKCSR